MPRPRNPWGAFIPALRYGTVTSGLRRRRWAGHVGPPGLSFCGLPAKARTRLAAGLSRLPQEPHAENAGTAVWRIDPAPCQGPRAGQDPECGFL